MMSKKDIPENQALFTRDIGNNSNSKKSIKTAWIFFIIILIASLLLEIIMTPHPYFGFDGFFGFYAAFGFLSCVAIVLISKFLGIFLKRKENYYENDLEEHK